MVGRAASSSASLMKLLKQATEGKGDKNRALFERIVNMNYTIVPDESVPEGTVVVCLSKEDMEDIKEQEKLNQDLHKEYSIAKASTGGVTEVGANTEASELEAPSTSKVLEEKIDDCTVIANRIHKSIKS
ncbi:hypothetical protein ACH5RR_008374 [Cinchona calisaya]|uniref:Uncharacterized protein n=1 Tax=Cinchona calisaya TaxID=153742 RepID=A0ABD3AF00_9GENT